MLQFQHTKRLDSKQDVKKYGWPIDVVVTTDPDQPAPTITGDEVIASYAEVQATAHRSSIFKSGLYWTGGTQSRRVETVIGNISSGQWLYTLTTSDGKTLLPYTDRYTSQTVYVDDSRFPKMYIPG